MRSQAAKPLPKKGALGKTSFKASKQVKKRTTAPKKAKASPKSVLKSPKKLSGDNAATGKNDGETSAKEQNDSASEAANVGVSRPNISRENSPSKKSKKESKETKDKAKASPKKVVSKRPVKLIKKIKPSPKLKADDKDNDEVKYKINLVATKKGSVKSAKSNSKKGNAGQKRKGTFLGKERDQAKEKSGNVSNSEKVNIDDQTNSKIEVEGKPSSLNEIKLDQKEEKMTLENPEMKIAETPVAEHPQNVTAINVVTMSQSEIPKVELERPPKFFTSSRSPRTVDIDVKCCKNSKGNLSVSERFLSMKCESKTDVDCKEKSSSNTLISQGPDIDVYTFTEKVDSPKSILSDFRTPINKNVGRVRPIARVKGTVIDKKADPERKKYSPHRPIEEVVKQLKANKRSEDVITSQTPTNYESSGLDFGIFANEKEAEKPPIVSKSYKMVARKSSITGQPFSPIKFPDQEESAKKETKSQAKTSNAKKNLCKSKKQQKKTSLSDEDINTSTFSLNTKTFHYSSSEESVSESNDDNDNKESSESDNFKTKRTKGKKYKRITDSAKKTTSKELKELSKDSLIDLKDTSALLGNEKPSKRRLKLLSMWSGPKKHRMASLNALAKVHCLYENESRTHMELGLMKTVDRQVMPSTSKVNLAPKKKENKSKDSEKVESTSESEYENKGEKEKDSSDSSDDSIPQRTLRGVPGIRSAGKYWDPKSSTSSSEDSELEFKTKKTTPDKKKITPKSSYSSNKSDPEKPPSKMKKTAGVPVKKKRNRNEVVMDLKDMVVQKRMASLNATAILAASYEKRSPKSSKDDTTSDSYSDESFSQKPKNLLSSGVKSESKNEETEKESDDTLIADKKQKVEVIVNQDTDVTITGVYATHHHEGFCTVSGMQYRISSTSHTQTTATANCEKEGCSKEETSRYTPLSALSSMQPPAEHTHTHPHPVPELGGLSRRPGCSSAFSAPSPAAHHDPGYYQPAGPLIKESSADAERALARYHPPHYHAPHPPVLQQYGPYYPAELCYGRYYRPPGPYHIPPPQPEAQMVGVGSEPYPPQYYGTPPCYQHSPQRIPYVEYRGCPCPLNACPKNVLIGPATGKAPTGGGPADVPSALAPPGAAFRPKARACALDSAADNHGSGKDPPLEPEPPEPPTAADAPHPCPLPAIGGASPKREMYDVRENHRLTADVPGPTEALGPLSPARGACAPQPTPSAPRRARLGKAMARRSLAGDDTGLLMSTLQSTVVTQDADDDVLAISPPVCAPIDLSSSDEISTPLVDVKKENEGPTYASSRKTDAQALREHNCSTAATDALDATDAAKAVKRRYSKPKLEIEMKDVQLEDACKTNGIGEHVKLQKRRKVSGDQTNVPRIETITKEPKKKSPYKRSQKASGLKKVLKRKSDTVHTEPKPKKNMIDKVINDDPRLTNVAAVPDDNLCLKPKTKSALLLDNLIKKNSIDRPEVKGYKSDTKLNPAELFLSPNENCTNKNLNINNNIVENNVPVNGVQPKAAAETIAAVSQLIEKNRANKNACKVEKVESKVTHNLMSVLSTPTEALNVKEVLHHKPLMNGVTNLEKNSLHISVEDEKLKIMDVKEKCEQKDISVSVKENSADAMKPIKTIKPLKNKTLSSQVEAIPQSLMTGKVDESQIVLSYENKVTHPAKSCEKLEDSSGLDKSLPKRSKLYIDKTNGDFKSKNVEKLVKLLTSKKLASKATELLAPVEQKNAECNKDKDILSTKRCKLVGEKASVECKSKNVEKVVKLLVSKKTVIKTDEASLVVEDACSSPVPSLKKTRRRRSGGRRMRRVAVPLTPPDLQPRVQPKWSNGWNWDGDHYISKVYQNNDTRLDRTARCWARMRHASGDRVARGDCVLLRASLKPTNDAQPYVARVASLWEDPDNGEMMVSLVWYYRPEHTERGRQATDAPDEVFASRHRDANSVACIEDKCYVLTFNEYCRYKKRLKAAEEGITIGPSIVPPLPASELTPALAPNDTKLPPAVSPELVLFCRKIYDFRSKKIHVPNK